MNRIENLRVAWLFPTLEQGNYWQPIFREFTKLFPQTTVYTGYWPGYTSGFEDTFTVEVVGKTRFIETNKTATGHPRGFIYVSPNIVNPLLRSKPQVIFTSAFSVWTLLVLLFKPLGKWRVVIIYDGSAPSVDYQDSKTRLLSRRLMAQLTDAFVANSRAGKVYLTKGLQAKEERVFSRPYLVPDATALLQSPQSAELDTLPLQRPIFLFVGQVIYRKGLNPLLEACSILHAQGCDNYTLLIVGDGEQRQELEATIQAQNLQENVSWVGWVEYGSLGNYFQQADVFVFPTLEDVWGMVVPEAMVLGKPILCSKGAGAAELIVDGENGYIFDPHEPKELAHLMRRFIEQPQLARSMGQKSQQLIAEHTPDAAAKFLSDVASFTCQSK